MKKLALIGFLFAGCGDRGHYEYRTVYVDSATVVSGKFMEDPRTIIHTPRGPVTIPGFQVVQPGESLVIATWKYRK